MKKFGTLEQILADPHFLLTDSRMTAETKIGIFCYHITILILLHHYYGKKCRHTIKTVTIYDHTCSLVIYENDIYESLMFYNH